MVEMRALKTAAMKAENLADLTEIHLVVLMVVLMVENLVGTTAVLKVDTMVG